MGEIIKVWKRLKEFENVAMATFSNRDKGLISRVKSKQLRKLLLNARKNNVVSASELSDKATLLNSGYFYQSGKAFEEKRLPIKHEIIAKVT